MQYPVPDSGHSEDKRCRVTHFFNFEVTLYGEAMPGK